MTVAIKTLLIDIIAGARPNFMKIAPIIRAFQLRQAGGSRLRYRLVHTGQHYDARMSGDFFDQLGIPKPDINLEVGSGTQAEQTSAIMIRYEKLLLERRSDLCLVVGDVTSTMACSIAAQKLCLRTVSMGTNELIGTDPSKLSPILNRLFAGKWKRGAIPEKWDGRSGERIVKILDRLVSKGIQ